MNLEKNIFYIELLENEGKCIISFTTVCGDRKALIFVLNCVIKFFDTNGKEIPPKKRSRNHVTYKKVFNSIGYRR